MCRLQMLYYTKKVRNFCFVFNDMPYSGLSLWQKVDLFSKIETGTLLNCFIKQTCFSIAFD